MKLLTWLDVRRKILDKTNFGLRLPQGVTRISSFSDAVEIGVTDQAAAEKAKRAFEDWFGDWFLSEESVIQLDIDGAELPVEFQIEEKVEGAEIPVRPFWEEITYLQKNDENGEKTTAGISLPKPFPSEKPKIYAFYSFKGGVGRTLHLSAYLFALLERFREEDKKILVIDADLEAPGLTYWNRLEKQQPPGISFIDFLEAYHYPPTNREETLAFFARELKRYVKTEGKSKVYFLPACVDDKELLDTPVLPEHLVRSRQSAWIYGDALYRLGRALDVEYLFIDMRSGTSEISGPLLFDPRVRRLVVTTVVEQSVRGTRLVLEHIGRVLQHWNPDAQPEYFDPVVLLTMLDPDIRKTPAFENALEGLRSSYLQSEKENILSERLEITESDFNPELLYIQSWEEAREKLGPTSIMKMARAWADEQVRANIFRPKPADPPSEVKKLEEICRKYEFAESGEGEDLLITEPLRNLATVFREELPKVVSIGAKGAGKTFNYLQLARFGFWENFVRRVLDEDLSAQGKTHIFPLLQSKNLHRKAEDLLEDARSLFYAVHPEGGFSPSGFRDQMEKIGDEINRSVWAQFWVRGMAEAIGITLDSDGPQAMLNEMNQWLKEKETRIIFIFDGLEDLFADISSRPSRKSALESLIDLPKRISEIRQTKLGIIIFLRRDFLRYAITENLKQFENLYQPYDLHWNEEAFLKLVFWICTQADILGAKADELATLGREELIARLYELWGMKLGTNHSREAYAVRWIYAALTDFKGRLQARDIVRLLYHAAEITSNSPEEVAFEKWSQDRLLPPQSIRRALKPCSVKKVEETKEEYPIFREWVDDVLVKYPAADRRIPFTAEQFEMIPQTIKDLEDMGVIFEDRGKEGTPLYYIPEIFREGLDFSLDKGARPRVLILKRKALGRGTF